MQHRRMVFAAYLSADSRQRAFQQIPAHIHGDLPGLDYLPFSGFGQKIIHGDIEILADSLLHLVYGNIVFLLADYFGGYFFSELYGNFLVRECSIRNEGYQSPFKFPEIGRDTAGKIYHDIIKSIWLKGQYQKALDAVLCDLIGSEPDLSQITSGDVLLELEAIRRRIKQLRSGKPNTDDGCQSSQ